MKAGLVLTDNRLKQSWAESKRCEDSRSYLRALCCIYVPVCVCKWDCYSNFNMEIIVGNERILNCTACLSWLGSKINCSNKLDLINKSWQVLQCCERNCCHLTTFILCFGL